MKTQKELSDMILHEANSDKVIDELAKHIVELTQQNRELIEALKFAQTSLIVAKREEALKWEKDWDKANEWAKNHHQIQAIDKLIKGVTVVED